MANKDLLIDFVSAYPAQPATAYWRAIEIGALLHHGVPPGLGLDLGCGDGLLTDIILRHGGARHLVGIDPDPLEIDAARKFSFYDRLHTAPGSAIPEPDGIFDFVLSNSVLEHVPDLEATITEAARVLRPGGVMLFTVPAPGFHRNLKGRLRPGGSREAYLRMIDRRLHHLRYMSADDWAAMFACNGLALTDAKGYLDRRETRRWETLSRMTGGLLYALVGERKRPIEIQRALGARALQNRMALPRAFAPALARLIAINAPVDRHEGRWLDPNEASCLLIAGRKPA